MTDDQPPPDDEQPEQDEPEQDEPEQDEPDEDEPDEDEPEGCPILDLNLGPLDLNLLGLRVELNETDLDITAEPGDGNLLGNLLCAVAGLLDGVDLSGILGDLLQRR